MTKKKYLSPDAKVIQVKPAEIICTSDPQTKSYQFEEYEEDDNAFGEFYYW